MAWRNQKIMNKLKLWISKLFKKPKIKPKKPTSPIWDKAYQAYLTQLIAELEFQIHWLKKLRQIAPWIWNSPDNFFEPKEVEPKQLQKTQQKHV